MADELKVKHWILVDATLAHVNGTVSIHSPGFPTKDPDIRRRIREEFAEEIVEKIKSSASIKGLVKAHLFTLLRTLAAKPKE